MTTSWTPDIPGAAPATVLCAVLGRSEGEVVSVLAASAEILVTRRCADLAELLAAAATGLGQVAVVSGHLPGLDRTAVSALKRDGTRVVAILDEGGSLAEPNRNDRLTTIGCEVLVARDLVRTNLVRAVLALAQQPIAAPPGPAGPGTPGEYLHAGAVHASDDLVRPTTRPDSEVRAPRPIETTSPLLIAVWGPTGAPGRSTIAANLAAELVVPEIPRRRGRRAVDTRVRPGLGPVETALLVDADTYSGSLGQAMGMLDESSGLATACRAAAHGALPVEALAAITPLIAPNLRILTGIARASRWPEVTEPALEVLWESCKLLARWTVVDCGFAIERDEMLSYDTRAPQRNDATLSALAAADIVVVVGGADAVSVQRLVRALDDLAESGVAERAQQLVVVNRVRASAVGPRPSTAVREALRRYSGIMDLVLVPDDQPVVDAALFSGRTFAESAPSSAVRHAVRELAVRVRDHGPAPQRVENLPVVGVPTWQAVPSALRQ